MKKFALLVAFASLPALACSGANSNLKTGAPPPEDYVIGPEDVLEVSVWKEENLSKTVPVRPDGKISLPLVGELMAAGLTPAALRDQIAGKLKSYLRGAEVVVIVREVNSQKVFVVGEVRRPGSFGFKANLSVAQALALAGGLTDYAAPRDITVVRRNEQGEKRINVDFRAFAEGGGDLWLKGGDTIVVP